MNHLPKIEFEYNEDEYFESISIEFPKIFNYSKRLKEIFEKDYLKTNNKELSLFSKLDVFQKTIVDSFASFEGIMEELLKDYSKKMIKEIKRKSNDLNNSNISQKGKKFYKKFNLWNTVCLPERKLDFSFTYKNIFENIKEINYFAIKEENKKIKEKVIEAWRKASPTISLIKKKSPVKYLENIVDTLYKERNTMVHTSKYKENKNLIINKDINHINLMLIFLFFMLSVEYMLQKIFPPIETEKLKKNNIEICSWEIHFYDKLLERTKEENKFIYFEDFFEEISIF